MSNKTFGTIGICIIFIGSASFFFGINDVGIMCVPTGTIMSVGGLILREIDNLKNKP